MLSTVRSSFAVARYVSPLAFSLSSMVRQHSFMSQSRGIHQIVNGSEPAPPIFDLTDEQKAWRDVCHKFMEKEITNEYLTTCDVEKRFPKEGYAKIAKAGWLKFLIPTEHGGDGGDVFNFTLMCEALGKYGPDFGTAILVPMFTAMNIVHYGTDDQKKRYLEPFMRGDSRFCISISEPQAGSDAANIQTTAVKKDDSHWILNGQKQWCTGAAADSATICMLVRTSPWDESSPRSKHQGLTMFLVPNNAPGLRLQSLHTMARRSTGTSTIFLDDILLDESHFLLGAVGQGWEIATRCLQLERVSLAATYVGCAQTVVDEVLQYTTEREQFSRRLADFQVIRHTLADMQTQVEAARLMVYSAASELSTETREGRTRDLTKSSMAKLFASETLQKVSRDGVQLMGGVGMLKGVGMERYFREGMQSTIGGGTSQIMREIIAKSLLKRSSNAASETQAQAASESK